MSNSSFVLKLIVKIGKNTVIHLSSQKNIDITEPTTRLKVILSFGIGRLHFIQAAEAITEIGVDCTVIQGWVPKKFFNTSIIDALGRVIGSTKLSNGMQKRRMDFLPSENMKSIAWPEFLEQIHRIFGAKIRSTGLIQTLAWVSFGWASRKYINEQKVLHVRSGAGGGGAIAKAKKRGVPVLVDHSIAHINFLTESFVEMPSDNYLRVWMNKENMFWKRVISDCINSNHLVVNSDFVKKTFLDAGFPENKISVVYLGVREDFLSLKTDYEINHTPRMIFTGSFGWRKGANDLINALCLLDEGGIDFQFKAVGTVDDQFRSDERIRQLGKKFEFIGHVPQDELKAHLSWADLYVFPSLAEGCASSGMEALAAGVPVICTTESGLPIVHGEDGYIVPRGDPTGIANAIKVLLSDNAFRSNIGKAASIKIKENYSWGDYADNMIGVYNKLL